MFGKYNFKYKRSGVGPILTGAFIGLLVQLVLSAVMAYFVEEGRVPQSATTIVTVTSRMIGVLAATVTTWNMTPDRRFHSACIAVVVLVSLPLIVGALMWDINASGVFWGAGASALAFGVCVLLLNRPKRQPDWIRKDKRYC